jgi:hypothetical protein
MLLSNATVRILRPVRMKAGTDSLERETRYDLMPEQRASLRRLTPGQAYAVLGQVAVNTWSLRFRPEQDIGPGTMIQAQRDGDDDWHSYKVLTVSTNFYARAILEAVEG